MNSKVYVDNLAAATTESELRNLFSAYGNVVEVNIAVDRTNHKPRGFGFVTMVTPEGARAAIQALHGKAIGTGTLTVSEAWPSEERVGSLNGRPGPRRRPSYLY
jgi:cold-inducible RNA-binding protein